MGGLFSFLPRLWGPPDVPALEARGEIKKLIKALQYRRDAQVRRAAAQALGRIADEEAVKSLALALDDADLDVCRAAAPALGQIGSPRAVDHLLAFLQGAPPELRSDLIKGLGQAESGRAVPFLLRILEGEQDARVREATVVALGDIGDQRAVAPLASLLGGQDRKMRHIAAGALAKVGQPAVGVLVEAVRSPRLGMRWAAAEALGEIGAQAVDPLLDLFDQYADLRKVVAWTLAQTGDERALEPLSVALTDPDQKVRCVAAKALTEVDGKQSMQLLLQALQDQSKEVREAAAKSLETMTGKDFGEDVDLWRQWVQETHQDS